MTIRHFKVAIAKNDKERGIGIEEHTIGEGCQVVYIASLHTDGMSQQETFNFYINHILSLLDDDEKARIRVLDYSLKRKWAVKYSQAEIVPYRRGQGRFRSVIQLSIDGLERKTNITEVL